MPTPPSNVGSASRPKVVDAIPTLVTVSISHTPTLAILDLVEDIFEELGLLPLLRDLHFPIGA